MQPPVWVVTLTGLPPDTLNATDPRRPSPENPMRELREFDGQGAGAGFRLRHAHPGGNCRLGRSYAGTADGIQSCNVAGRVTRLRVVEVGVTYRFGECTLERETRRLQRSGRRSPLHSYRAPVRVLIRLVTSSRDGRWRPDSGRIRRGDVPDPAPRRRCSMGLRVGGGVGRSRAPHDPATIRQALPSRGCALRHRRTGGTMMTASV